jgi:hypothetical protein
MFARCAQVNGDFAGRAATPAERTKIGCKKNRGSVTIYDGMNAHERSSDDWEALFSAWLTEHAGLVFKVALAWRRKETKHRAQSSRRLASSFSAVLLM